MVLPILTDEEVRVLGCLIEKQKLTPAQYPMTVNGIRVACNQKTSRNPVVDYDDNTVIRTLDGLRDSDLVAKVVGDGRATKYRHNLSVNYPLDPADITILCLLMLRGPLTAGEINSNSGRLFDFENIEEVNEKLEELSNMVPPFVKRLERRPGQKESRFIHLLSTFDEDADYSSSSTSSTSVSSSEIEELKSRIEALEEDVRKLREHILEEE